jgi:Protein of unknwon function (DUF3008)
MKPVDRKQEQIQSRRIDEELNETIRDLRQALTESKKKDRADEAHQYKGTYDGAKKRRKSMTEESDDTRDNRAEKAGKKVTKDIEYDEKKKDGIHGKKRGSEDAKAERAGKKVAKDIEYDEKKDRADEEKKPSSGLSKEKKSSTVKKAKAGKDIGHKGKGFKSVAKKAAKEYGSKEAGERVAAAAMWKNMKREGAGEEIGGKRNSARINGISEKNSMHPTMPAGPRVLEEDEAMYELRDSLSDLEGAITTAIEIGQSLLASARNAKNREVYNQLKSYTIPWLKAFISDARQQGSIKAMIDSLDGNKEEVDEMYFYDRKKSDGKPQDVLGRRKPGEVGARPEEYKAMKKDPRWSRDYPVGGPKGKLPEEEELDEKAVSKKQQKFMGMVHAAQQGEKPASKKVAKVAKSMKKGDVEDFAKTKQKGLPEKKKKKAEESASAGATSSGSVAPSEGGKKTSKGGVQYGKSVYESFNDELESIIRKPQSQEIAESVVVDDLSRLMETVSYINQKNNHKPMLREAMNVSVNVGTGSDGQPTKNITVTADGDDADELARILNLSGMQNQEQPEAEIEVVDENKPDWPTNTETSNDPLQYSGGMNGPKSTGQTTIPVTGVAPMPKRGMAENLDLERSLFKLYQKVKGA